MSNNPKGTRARKTASPKASSKIPGKGAATPLPLPPSAKDMPESAQARPLAEAAPPVAKPFALPVNAVFLKKALRFLADLPKLLLPDGPAPRSGADPNAVTDEAVNAALAGTGELLGVSRVYVMLDEEDGRFLRNTHEWVDGKIGPAMYSWPLHEYEKDLPSLKPLMAGREFFHVHTRDSPPDFKRVLSMQAVDSVLLVPLMREGEWIGLVGFDECGQERDWREEETAILRALARLVAVALERRGYHAAQGRLERIRNVLDESEAGARKKAVPQVPENPESLQAAERRLILETLNLYQGNRLRAAKHLGLAWAALDRRCKKLGIEVKKG